jgi:hypothetical protein
MERGALHLHNESLKEEVSYDETAAQLELSSEAVEEFLRTVNAQIEGEKLDSFNGDTLVALIEAYVTDNMYPERVEAIVARLINVLKASATNEESVSYEDIMYIRQHMPKVLARRFEILRDARVDPNEFSAVAVHNFRQHIDSDENFFSGPLDGDEVRGLMSLYALSRVNYNTRRKAKPLDPKILDRQLTKLSSYLKGRRPVDIKKDFNGEGINDMPNIMNILEQKLAWFALHPDELQKVYETGLEEAENKNNPVEIEPPELIQPPAPRHYEAVAVPFDRMKINKIIESFLEAGMLPQEYMESFGRHIGFYDELLPDPALQQRNDACEKVRRLIGDAQARDCKKYGVKITNLPTLDQLRIIGQILGNREEGIDPVPKMVLIHQFTAELRRWQPDIDQYVLRQKTVQYRKTIDLALAQTLQWAVAPKYRYPVKKRHQESA